MKRLLFLAAVILPNCTGCVAFGYPTVHHVPEITVPNPDGSVHAFRVDVDTTQLPDGVKTQYVLSRIPVDPRGNIPSQLEVAATYGFANPFNVADVKVETNKYTMLVRVYRPGYRTIEVQQWDKSHELQWLPAAQLFMPGSDLIGQEKAVDDLLLDGSARSTAAFGSLAAGPNPPLANRTWWDGKDAKSFGLQPGSVSSLHRQALQFAAAEYARLAASPAAQGPTMQSVRERLQQKAIWLKKWADEAPGK